jgi:hypothetical protein
MILDAQNKFSNGQAITASAVSTNTLDKLAEGEALIEPLWLVVRVNTAFASADGTATLQVKLQTADAVDGNNALTSATDLIEAGLFAVTDLVAGKELLKIKLPPGQRRYVALDYVVGTENFTAGAVDAYLTPDAETATQMLRPVL